MLGPNFREAPDIMKGVIQRGRRGPNDVWFAEIAFYAGGLRCRLQQSPVINDSLFLPDQFQYFLKAWMTSEGIQVGVVLDPSTP